MGCAIAILVSGCQILPHQRRPNPPKDITQLLQDLEANRNIQTCDGHLPKRADVAKQLGELGDPQAIDPLIDILSSPDESYLSRGAAGCEPGGKMTYRPAIYALGKFGPQAQRATPRLLEMLQEEEHRWLAPSILETLVEINPDEDLLPLLIPLFVELAPSADRPDAYLKALVHFRDKLRPYSESLTPALQQIDIDSLKPFGKTKLLEGLLYSGAFETNTNQIETLLFDLKTVQSVNLKAFSRETQSILPQVIKLLENFDIYFSDTELLEYGAFCGSSNLEGAKNHIRSQIFSILIAICTPESLEVVKNYKQRYGITESCEFLKSCENSSSG